MNPDATMTPMTQRTPRTPPPASMALPAARGQGRSRDPSQTPRWLRGKRPVFQFVGLFALLLGGLYVLSLLPGVDRGFLKPYMRLTTTMSAALLNVFGEGATAQGTFLSSPRTGVDIEHGCDALEPSVLFVAAVIAFPSPWLLKIPGLLLGTVAISFFNLLRIASLFYAKIHWPNLFDILHVDIWQPIFVALALALWVLWAWWATKRSRAPADVGTGTGAPAHVGT